MKKYLVGVAVLITVVVTLVACLLLNDQPTTDLPTFYNYSIVGEYPHDTGSFTQGLVFDNGFLYEGTGLWGSSTLRKVELESGKSLQNHALPDEFFGEGITVFGDRIIQLTWQSQIGFVYDKATFNVLRNFSYTGEGWGITNDGHNLIMSNGSATLQFVNPETFEIIGQIQVHDGNENIAMLNELEFINGDIYANIWQEDKIAIINAENGLVRGWIDLTGLYTTQQSDQNNVLNGIAYDGEKGRLLVTGKRWPKLFDIKIKPAT
jgi:glutamine cyclotransferase